jgi:hypothetical protein
VDSGQDSKSKEGKVAVSESKKADNSKDQKVKGTKESTASKGDEKTNGQSDKTATVTGTGNLKFPISTLFLCFFPFCD